ncbi:hypothetical protein KTD19_30650 [Burkholderia multivorans]|nr:hypothetical protein [Burkholderia multivorans]MBU9236729.1 hypothetical protein [Burkholderia multivorans]
MIQMAGRRQGVLPIAVWMHDQAGGGAMPKIRNSRGDIFAIHAQVAIFGIGLCRHPQDRSQAIGQPEGFQTALGLPQPRPPDFDFIE